jgi:hypothetical protein
MKTSACRPIAKSAYVPNATSRRRFFSVPTAILMTLMVALWAPATDASALRSEPAGEVATATTLACKPSTALPSDSRGGSYVVQDNFESGTLSKWTVTDEGDAWAGATDDYRWTGGCSGRLIVTSSSTSRANAKKGLPSGTYDVWAIGNFRILKEGNSGSNVPTFRFFDGSKRILDVHRQNISGDLWLRAARGDGSWKYVKLNRHISLNTWYRLVVHVRPAWGSSRIQVLLNRELLFSSTSYYLPAGHLTKAMVGAEHVRQKMDMVFDDIVIKAAS